MLGLSDLLDRRPRNLSGGQRQRVAMGRAIVREPQVFLMDEPQSNLDAKLRVQMRAEIARIQDTLGVTTVYVTHDQTEAMTLGDRVAVMRKGELQQVGTPQHLYDEPVNLFVAGFIGSPAMNLFEATVEGRAGRAWVRLGSQALALPRAVEAHLGGYDRAEVIVGIRPEDMEDSALARPGPGGRPGGHPGSHTGGAGDAGDAGGPADARIGAGAFLLPALVLLGALVVYPTAYTLVRSLFDRSGHDFVGLHNYKTIFTSSRTLRALRNNVVWVVVAPAVVTAAGLVFAVLTERVRWSTAFKVVVFMPMAVSMLAAGVIFRIVYEQDPSKGVANAVIDGVRGVFTEPSLYPGARPRSPEQLPADGKAFRTAASVAAGQTVEVGLVGVPPASVPHDARQAAAPPAPVGPAATSGVRGVVWLDFALGGGGRPGVIDPREKGLPGVRVSAVRGGKVVAHDTTDDRGRFRFSGIDGPVQVRLDASNFRAPFRGVQWLGPSLVTPAVIGAYIWIWAGFAMVVIAAGLAAIPRDVLEAARVDGATEWQVFRRVTVPLLAPVIAVVIVTLMINVLKVFDLVLVTPPGSVQADANVLALEMWRVSFGGGRDEGLGSALGIFLFLLVIPAMAFNIRRFRREALE